MYKLCIVAEVYNAHILFACCKEYRKNRGFSKCLNEGEKKTLKTTFCGPDRKTPL